MWPDWAIYCQLSNFTKQFLATLFITNFSIGNCLRNFWATFLHALGEFLHKPFVVHTTYNLLMRYTMLWNKLTKLLKTQFPFSRRQRVRERRVHCPRRLHPLRPLRQARLLHHGHGLAQTHHPQGGQANGDPWRRRSRVPATQVRVLHEGHGSHVPLPVTRENHPVPGEESIHT